MQVFTRFVALFILLFGSKVFAWSEFEHMVIAELALQKLEPKLQRKLEQQAFSLVKQQDTERRLYLMRAFAGSSAFAQVSVFADTYRRTNLKDLYGQFGSGLPEIFVDMPAEDTSAWHYKNQVYDPGVLAIPGQELRRQCDLSAPTDVAWAIDQLKQAFISAETEANQVLSMAMLMHFVADAHQPLHAISRVDEGCESDLGGNRFCVSYRSNSLSCETNLHAFWDSALGFFEAYESVADAVDFVSRVELDEVQARNLDPDEWLAEGFTLARFVYSVNEGSGGDPYYVEEGQIVAYERMALAAERLALILNELY